MAGANTPTVTGPGTRGLAVVSSDHHVMQVRGAVVTWGVHRGGEHEDCHRAVSGHSLEDASTHVLYCRMLVLDVDVMLFS